MSAAPTNTTPARVGSSHASVPPAEYFPFIDDFLDAEPDAGIFFATDQMQFRDEMADRYGERVVWYASTLSTSAVNAFQMQRPGGQRQP